jgi:hypothetical protein
MKIRLLTDVGRLGKKGAIVDVPIQSARALVALSKAIRFVPPKPVQLDEPKPKRSYRRRKPEGVQVVVVEDVDAVVTDVEVTPEVSESEADST